MSNPLVDDDGDELEYFELPAPVLTEAEQRLMDVLFHALKEENNGRVLVSHDEHWCRTLLDGDFNLIRVLRKAGLIK